MCNSNFVTALQQSFFQTVSTIKCHFLDLELALFSFMANATLELDLLVSTHVTMSSKNVERHIPILFNNNANSSKKNSQFPNLRRKWLKTAFDFTKLTNFG